MDIASAVLIALGAVIGVIMLTNLLKGHHIPKALTFIHGGFVITGLLLLIVFNLCFPLQANWISVVFFVLAAMGGLYILFHDIKHQKVPILIVIVHASIAVTGLAIMLYKIKQFHATL